MDEADRKNGNPQTDKAQTNLLRRTAAAEPPYAAPVVPSEPPKPKAPTSDTHWIDKVARVLFPLCYFSFVFSYFAYYASVLDYSLKLI